MADLGLWNQRWTWVLSQKHVVTWAHAEAGCGRDLIAFLFDRHWSAVSRACVSSLRLVLEALRQWRGCMARGLLSNGKASMGSTTQACGVPMATWLLLPSFLWPAPPPLGSSCPVAAAVEHGGDKGDFKRNVGAALTGVHLGRSFRHRLAALLCSTGLSLCTAQMS